MLSSLLVVLIPVVIFGLLCLFSWLFKINKTKIFDIVLKSLTVILIMLMTVRCFLNDDFINVIKSGWVDGRPLARTDYLTSVLRWFQYSSTFIIGAAVFYKNRTFRNMAKYFCLPFNIVNAFFMDRHLQYFNTDSASRIGSIHGFQIDPNIRTPFFYFECALFIIIPLILFLCDFGKKKYGITKRIIHTVLGVVFAVGLTIPTYLPQSFFGFTNYYFKTFNIYHMIWIIVCFVLFIVIYFLFRFKDREARFSVLLMFGLYLFIHYNTIYSTDLVASRLPLQLCNLGAYLILVSMIIKKQKFFNFVFIANIIGSFIAIIMVDIQKTSALSFMAIHYLVEHTWVFILPLLMVALRMFELPDLKKNCLLHFVIGFTIYFAICWVGGFVFNCYLYDPTSKFFNHVNYFYIYDDKVMKTFPFIGFSYKWRVEINGFRFYPIYQMLIYFGYGVICCLIYFLFFYLTKVSGRHMELRKTRIEYLEKKGFYKKLHLQVPAKEIAESED